MKTDWKNNSLWTRQMSKRNWMPTILRVKTILILEDDADRIRSFNLATASLGEAFRCKIWRDAPTMMAECEAWFPDTALISLDHDLNPVKGSPPEVGTGLDVARFLGDFQPACPVIIHSSNTDRAWSMHNELRFAGWPVERVGPLGNDWIAHSWMTRVRALLESTANTWRSPDASDHLERVARMILSLDGLSIGDAMGEMLASRAASAPRRLEENDLPAGPWLYTDDTEMAISIAAVLKSHGAIDQDLLAKRFARRFERDPERGYGRMTRIQLREINAGAKWRETAMSAFGGQGSMGNGGAMRVPPLGAYFADDFVRVVTEARLSAEVTHTHPEGLAGTIATAVAAAAAWRLRGAPSHIWLSDFFAAVLDHTPESKVRRLIGLAREMMVSASIEEAARLLGNGTLVTAPDTVPFALWVAARHHQDFAKALGAAVVTGGDCDTNAAIVGGVVSLTVGREGVPGEWLHEREVHGL